MNRRAHVIVSGRVQGVGFRDWARSEATRLSVRGWARNLPTGDVELLAEGAKEQVEALVNRCRTGPSMARVIEFSVSFEDDLNEFDDFRVVWF
jgi:acylphosphatase